MYPEFRHAAKTWYAGINMAALGMLEHGVAIEQTKYGHLRLKSG